jgi:hypothetical protein
MKGPAQSWRKEDLHTPLTAPIILPKIIVKDEKNIEEIVIAMNLLLVSDISVFSIHNAL